MPDTIFVRIVNVSIDTYWYMGQVGYKYNVQEYDEKRYRVVGAKLLIDKRDAEVVLPNNKCGGL